jgi:hypothetical protein
MYVKNIYIGSGPAAAVSGNNRRWDLYSDNDKYLGSLFTPVYFETKIGAGTYYPAVNPENLHDVKLYNTMHDAVKSLDIPQSENWEYYDEIYNLFFDKNYKLIP